MGGRFLCRALAPRLVSRLSMAWRGNIYCVDFFQSSQWRVSAIRRAPVPFEVSRIGYHDRDGVSRRN